MSGTRIAQVTGRRVWDSRGRPTVEAEILLENGVAGRAIAPAGASRGSNEAVDLRDGGAALGGWGVSRALAMVNGEIAAALHGMAIEDQAAIDARLIALDGTPNKARLGGNATTAVSMAALHAAAAAAGRPLWRHLLGEASPRLPLPQIQIFGGGAHASRRIDVQDFMVLPIGASSFDEATEMAARVYHAAGAIMAERGLLRGVADEGGWWPEFAANEAALDTLVRAIERAGLLPGQDVAIALDVAATQLRAGERYRLAAEERLLDSSALIAMLGEWCRRYPILSIEDPVAEDDAEGMRAVTAALGDKVQIIGDDFLVTSAARIEAATIAGACNAALLKPNQVGTITETLDALHAARAAGWRSIISARSGETEDVTIVHLAIGWGADQLKVGSFARSERMAKWNEALRIEAALDGAGHFAGREALGGRDGR